MNYIAKEAEALQQQGTLVSVAREPALVHYHFSVFKLNCDGANTLSDVVNLSSLSGVSCVYSDGFSDLRHPGFWKGLDGN